MQRRPEGECGAAQVSTDNLERVRKVKTRHQRLLARTTTVREELERFLEDDDDMAKMCLTRRAEVPSLPQQRGHVVLCAESAVGGGRAQEYCTDHFAFDRQSDLH